VSKPTSKTASKPAARPKISKGRSVYALSARGKKPKVTFNHGKHQRRTSCKKCHHKAKPGETPAACRSCHGKGKGPSFKKATHKFCKACHKKRGGPTSCKKCHSG